MTYGYGSSGAVNPVPPKPKKIEAVIEPTVSTASPIGAKASKKKAGGK